MNDDLKPGALSKRDGRPLTGIDVQQAFILAELVALRVRDQSVSEGSKLAAGVIAAEIRDLAAAWQRELPL